MSKVSSADCQRFERKRIHRRDRQAILARNRVGQPVYTMISAVLIFQSVRGITQATNDSQTPTIVELTNKRAVSWGIASGRHFAALGFPVSANENDAGIECRRRSAD